MQLDRAVDVFVQPVEHHTVLSAPHKTPIQFFHVCLFNIWGFFYTVQRLRGELTKTKPTDLPEWQLA